MLNVSLNKTFPSFLLLEGLDSERPLKIRLQYHVCFLNSSVVIVSFSNKIFVSLFTVIHYKYCSKIGFFYKKG